MSEKEFQNISSFFDSLGIDYLVVEHEEVRTSEEAARVRGSLIEDGVKAMVIEFSRGEKKFFSIANLRADKRVDLDKLKQILKADKIKLLSLERVGEITGCPPGGVPPLGHTPKLPVLVDSTVFTREFNEFNAGLKTKSIRLKSSDLRKAFQAYGAVFFEFSK